MTRPKNALFILIALSLAGCDPVRSTIADPQPQEVSLLRSLPAQAQLIASCGPSEGWAYYAETLLVNGKDAGWTKDQISKGATALIRLPNGDYDLRFADVGRGSASTLGEGGTIVLHRASVQEATFVVTYPHSTVETYQFVTDPIEGLDQGRLLQTQTKGGDGPIIKSGLLVSRCRVMRLSQLY